MKEFGNIIDTLKQSRNYSDVVNCNTILNGVDSSLFPPVDREEVEYIKSEFQKVVNNFEENKANIDRLIVRLSFLDQNYKNSIRF